MVESTTWLPDAYNCLIYAIKKVKPGNRLMDLAQVIQNHAFSCNFSV